MFMLVTQTEQIDDLRLVLSPETCNVKQDEQLSHAEDTFMVIICMNNWTVYQAKLSFRPESHPE